MRLESFLDVFDSQRRVSQQVELGPPSYRKKKKSVRNQSSFFWMLKIPFSVCVWGRSAVLTVKTDEGTKAATHLLVPHLLHWIHKQLRTRTRHGSYSQRSIPESPPAGSLSWVLEPPVRSCPPHSCCTARHGAGTPDPRRCCLHTDAFIDWLVHYRPHVILEHTHTRHNQLYFFVKLGIK